MFIEDCIMNLIEENNTLEEVVSMLLSENDAHYTPSSNKMRHPFKQGEYLGPGPKGMIHVSAKVLGRVAGTSGIPWKCSKVAPYQHMCIKQHPETGEILRRKPVVFDPDKVRERNIEYRAWAKAKREEIKQTGIHQTKPELLTAMQHHPILQFTSDPGTYNSWNVHNRMNSRSN